MARPEKEAQVRSIQDKLKNSTSVVLTEFRGLTVHELAELRRKLREQEVEYKVVKNTLAQIAADKVGLSELNDFLAGPTALASGSGDIIAPAKIIFEYSREHEALRIKGGILEGQVINADKVKALATLPSKEVLLATLLGNLNAPIAGFMNVLNGPMRGFAGVLSAISEQKANAA